MKRGASTAVSVALALVAVASGVTVAAFPVDADGLRQTPRGAFAPAASEATGQRSACPAGEGEAAADSEVYCSVTWTTWTAAEVGVSELGVPGCAGLPLTDACPPIYYQIDRDASKIVEPGRKIPLTWAYDTTGWNRTPQESSIRLFRTNNWNRLGTNWGGSDDIFSTGRRADFRVDRATGTLVGDARMGLSGSTPVGSVEALNVDFDVTGDFDADTGVLTLRLRNPTNCPLCETNWPDFEGLDVVLNAVGDWTMTGGTVSYDVLDTPETVSIRVPRPADPGAVFEVDVVEPMTIIDAALSAPEVEDGQSPDTSSGPAFAVSTNLEGLDSICVGEVTGAPPCSRSTRSRCRSTTRSRTTTSGRW